ncbi:MAG: hypothetical protein AB1510_10655 [Bacillota bacterium]
MLTNAAIVRFKNEYPLFFWLLLILVPLATLVPYVVLYYHAPEGTTFSGFIFASDDPDSYLANMHLAEYGWKFKFMFTAEDTTGGYIFLFYIFLGKLALLFKTSYVLMFHIARIISGIFLIFSGWLFSKTLPLTRNERKWGFVLFCLAVQFPAWCHKYWGLVIYNPEASPFINTLLLPHVAFSQALFLLGIYFFRRWLVTESAVTIAWGNILIIGLVVVYPYALLPFLAVCLVSFYFHERCFPIKKALKFGFFFIASIPYLIYLLMLTKHPDIRQWQVQSATVFSSPFEPIVFNIILTMSGIVGLFMIYRREGLRSELLWICAIPFLLVFLPFKFQERLLQGAGPCLSFAGGIAINIIETRIKRVHRDLLIVGLLVATSLPLITPIFNPPERSFLTNAEVSMYRWMQVNLTQNDVVLTDLPYSARIPGRAGCRVWCGHHDQTFKVDEKHGKLKRFFTDKSFDRNDLLKRNNINYILWDTANSLPPNNWLMIKKYDNLILFKCKGRTK